MIVGCDCTRRRGVRPLRDALWPRKGARRRSPGEHAPVEVAAKEVIAADEWQANGMREDGWQRIPQSAPIAQGIEQRFPKPCVAGSNPAGGAEYFS